MRILCLCFLSLFLTGCGPQLLIVKEEVLSKQRLASSYAKSPDPERTKFRKGRKLIVEWMLPFEYRANKDLHLRLYVVYGNLEQEVVEYSLNTFAGFVTHYVIDPAFTEKKGLLTYKAEIVNGKGEVIEEYKQQMWIKILDAKCEPQFHKLEHDIK